MGSNKGLKITVKHSEWITMKQGHKLGMAVAKETDHVVVS